VRGHALTEAVTVVSSVAAAWLVFALFVFAYGDSPAVIGSVLLQGTWGTTYGVGQVLFKATPLLFTGVAVEVALRAGMFNIGAEGQLAVASLAVALVGARIGSVPRLVGVPVVLVVAAAAGGAWAFVPAVLRARFGAHEVISTIMMNRVADAFIGAALGAGAALAGSVRTPDVASAARIARLDALVPAFRGSAVSLAFILSVGLAFVAQWALRRTRVGREVVLVGANPVACAAARVPVARRLMVALVASGACAGLASAGTVLGYKGYFEMGLGAGAGFGGIAVALLGRGRPLGLVLAAVFFGTLQQGGLAINARVPREVMDILQGVVIVSVALADARFRGGARTGAVTS
jgi:simple sugar transport system permease protein